MRFHFRSPFLRAALMATGREWMRVVRRRLRVFCVSVGLMSAGFGGWLAEAANQTATFSPVYGSENLPFLIRLERVAWVEAERPTVHSYVAAQWRGEWLILGGRTNGLHGMTGLNAFPTASANTDLWVLDRLGGRTWRRPLAETGLPTRTIDFLSATNHNFVQEEERLYVAGGYGLDRTAADFVTYDFLAEVDVDGLMDWVKAVPGAPPPAASVRTVRSSLFQVTGGALEKSGDHFLLVFGQNYAGRYRPHVDGTYTRQVRRFALAGTGAGLALDPATVWQSPPQDDFRRRDLNVVPVLRREPVSGSLVDEFLALAGVFTPTTGVWTVPVTITSTGEPTQPDPLAASTFKQGLHHYHSAKLTLFDRVTGDNFIVQFGGLSAQAKDPVTGAWVADPLVPFVHHVSCLVRSPDGRFHQTLLPAEFPDLRSTEGKRLFFGTNAEFFPADGTPMLRPRVIDLAALRRPHVIGHIFGGLVSDAPNGGTTHATGEIFAVSLEPRSAPPVPLDITALSPGTVSLWWPPGSDPLLLVEQSPDLTRWSEIWPTPSTPPLTLPIAHPHQFFRALNSEPTLPPQ